MRRTELADAAGDYVHEVLETYAPREDVYAEANGEYIRQSPLTISADVAAVIADAKGRFLGVGATQYQISETEQSFERSTIGTMLVGMSEELVDQVNYAVMIDILVGRRFDEFRQCERIAEIEAALFDIQRDLGEMAYAAVCAAALMRRHLATLVELGEYTPRGEADYVSQLTAECAESGAAMRGASGRSSAEIEANYNGRPPTFETPDGLDATTGDSQLECEVVEYITNLGRRPTPDTPGGLDEIVAASEMDDDGAGD